MPVSSLNIQYNTFLYFQCLIIFDCQSITLGLKNILLLIINQIDQKPVVQQLTTKIVKI